VSKHERAVVITRQVNEVTEILNGSINQMLATQDDLQVLEDKTDALASQAQNFQRSARSLKNNQWWKNCKMKLAICCGISTVILMAMLPLILQATSIVSDGGTTSTTVIVNATSGRLLGDATERPG